MADLDDDFTDKTTISQTRGACSFGISLLLFPQALLWAKTSPTPPLTIELIY